MAAAFCQIAVDLSRVGVTEWQMEKMAKQISANPQD
jgi:hypothetical protein